MRTKANKTADEKEIYLLKRRSGDSKIRVEEKKSTRRDVHTNLWREGSNIIEESETENSVSMQGTRLREKATIRYENALDDSMLYSEKQTHDLSKRLLR